MPVPSPRSKLLPARGNYADLAANVAELLDGEICYALDQDQYYQKEGSVLVSVGATKAQGLLAETAVQPGDLSDSAASGDYNDLTNTPALAAVATTGAYSDLTGTPSLATVATTGDYEDLTNKPTASDGSLEWIITASGLDDYLFQGPGFSTPTADPTITLQRGYTYKFSNTMGAHPFQIQSTIGIGGTAYDTGVTNNATSNGVVTFVVPQDAPNELFYQCTAHSSMGGTFIIGSAAGDSGIEEAPSDGSQYARQDGAWTVVVADGGGGGETGTTFGPFTAKHFHTFDSALPSQCSSDLQGYAGPISSPPDAVVGVGAADGRPSNSGINLAGDYSTAGGAGVGILTGQPFTISFWFYHDGAIEGFTSNIIGCTKTGVNNADGLLIRILSNDSSLSAENQAAGIGYQSMCLFNGNSNSEIILGTNFPVMDSVWRHYAFSHDGNGSYSCYVDGALHDTRSPGVQDFSDAGIYGTFDGEFTLMGNRNDSGRCYGILDNFAIYDEDIFAGVGQVPAEALLVPSNTDLTITLPPSIGASSQLDDVSSVVAMDRQVLVHNGTEYNPEFLTIGVNSDVDTTTTPPVGGQVLRYDGSKFVPSAGGSGSSSSFSQQAYSYHTFEATGAAGDPESSTLFDDWAGANQSNAGVAAIGNRCLDNSSSLGAALTMDWYANDDPVWIEFWYKHDGDFTTDQLVVGVGNRSDSTTYPGDNLGFCIRHTFDTSIEAGWTWYDDPVSSSTPVAGWMETSNALVLTVGESTSAKNEVKAFTRGVNMADNEWHHVAFMVEGVGSNNAEGKYSCYVDGALVYRNANNPDPYPSSNGSWECLCIGNTLTGNRGTRGLIDNFRMFRNDLPVTAGQTYYDIDTTGGDPFITPRVFNESAPSWTASDVVSTPATTPNQQYFFSRQGDDIAGIFKLGIGFRIVAVYNDPSAENYRWPSSQGSTIGSPPGYELDAQQVGNCLIDSYDWKIAIYTGPYDVNLDAGGWLEFSLNPPGGGGGGPA